MLKHENIIEKLTSEQKIALLTDTKEGYGANMDGLTIPVATMAELWAEDRGIDGEARFPSERSLANSWDETLFSNVAKCLATLGEQRGDNLFLLPNAGAASSVYGRELSEEPYLSGALVAAVARKFKESGIAYCLREPMCTQDDARFLDKEADISVIYDRIARPFKMVQNVGAEQCMLLSNERAEGSYGEANKKLFGDIVSKADRLVEVQDGDMTTAALIEGNRIMGGSSLVLSTALDNYRRIYRSLEEGGATIHELNMTLSDGAAISEEIINAALDKKLELAFNCQKEFKAVSEKDIDTMAYEAAKRSIVLVKNANRALPLRKDETLCCVGDIVYDNENTQYKNFIKKFTDAIGGKTVVGFERGYDLGRSVSTELIDEACNHVTLGSTTVAFVGLGAARERDLAEKPRLALPGNQIAMLTKLRKSSRKLVVVVCGERLPDMSFDILADAILLVPSRGAYVAKALAQILQGKACPCGKIAYAGYSNVDTKTREVQKRKLQDKQKIGPYIGYRYTDGNGEWTRYPVGFGLSYTGFEYSKIHIDRGGNVSFTVKNTGRIEGSEAAQIYVGMQSSSKIRAVKELKGFAQIRLKPGEKKTVTIPMGSLDVYDTDREKTVIEAGNYDVHVGPSAGAVVLSRKINLIGASLKKEDKKLSDYLHNVSNIVSEGYIMEAYCKPMNTKSKLKSFGAILLLATLFADVVYVIGCFMNQIDLLDTLYLSIFLVINGVLLGTSLVSIVIGALAQKRVKRKIEEQEMAATRELFKTVKPADVKTIDELFEGEFDLSLEGTRKKEVVIDERDASTYTYMAVDTDIPTLCRDLEAYFKECGLEISSKMARKILSAVMTSRLLVVRNSAGVSCEKIVEVLSGFFGTAPHAESFAHSGWDRSSLLRYNQQISLDKGSRIAPLMQAINSAIAEGNKACFFGLDGVKLENIGDMLMPYVQYFGNPEAEHRIVDGEESVTMPTNLWFVVAPDKQESIDDLPTFVANLATVVDIEATVVSESITKAARKHTTCHQMEALIFRAKKASEIEEDVWKNVDSLEEYVNEKTPYHIGNKLFLQLEKYIAVYGACQDDLREAMDSAVAGKLIPGVLNLLKGIEGIAENELSEILERIFTEEYSTGCRSLVKNLVIGAVKKAEPVVEEAPLEESAEPTVEEEPLEESAEPTVEEAAEEEETAKEAVEDVADGAETAEAEAEAPQGENNDAV